MQAEDAEQVAAAAASLGRRFSVADIAATSDLSVPKLLAVLRAPTSVPVAEPGVMMGLEINTLAMQGCRGGARRCRFVEMWLLTVVGLPV